MRRFVGPLCVAVALSACSWGSNEPNERSSPSTQPPVVTTEPLVSLRDFFDISVPLEVDLRSSPAVLMIPACFGGVDRVALVSADIRSTLWEIVLASPSATPLRVDEFSIGQAPEGFRISVPLTGGVPPSAIVVVNGPDHLGMVALDNADAPTPPPSCA